MVRARPQAFVLTDGSGRSGRSRLDSTRRVLAAAGARPGSIFGRFTDQQIYEAILHHHFEVFRGLADELAHALAYKQVAYIVGNTGEHQVAAGHYREVIRYQEHVRPLLEALQHHAGLARP